MTITESNYLTIKGYLIPVPGTIAFSAKQKGQFYLEGCELVHVSEYYYNSKDLAKIGKVETSRKNWADKSFAYHRDRLCSSMCQM